MPTEIVLPKMGLTMEEATILSWERKVGEHVKKDEVILEVETDKASLEVEAPSNGILMKINVNVGDTVAVGSVLGLLSTGEEDTKQQDSKKTEVQEKQVSPQLVMGNPINNDKKATISKENKLVRVSPAARKAAREKGVSLAAIRGTGPRGRIVLKDVYDAVEATKQADEPVVVESTQRDKKVSLTSMRKIIAARMTESFMKVPQFQLKREVNCSALNLTRDTLLAINDAPIKLSINDFIVQAVAKALKEFPSVNAFYVDAEAGPYIIEKENINIGLAVALDQGLVVPVIHQADKLTLIEIAQKRIELVNKAKEGKLKPAEMSGGTFTVSNLGAFSIDEFTAIVNPPETGILAIGQAKFQPIINEKKEIEIKPIMKITGSFDHRSIDGAEGARFIHYIVEQLQSSKWKLF